MNTPREDMPMDMECLRFHRNLENIHRSAAIGRIAATGLVFDSWAELRDTSRHPGSESYLKLQSILTDISGCDTAYSSYSFDDGGELSQIRETPIYPIHIFGSSGARLIYAGEPYIPTEDRHAMGFWDGTPEGLVKAGEYPVRHLRLNLVQDDLHYLSESENDVSVFSAPDMPPTAVHGKDIQYLNMSDDEFASISKVEKAFGEDAVEFLSGDSCRQILRALIDGLSDDIPNFRVLNH